MHGWIDSDEYPPLSSAEIRDTSDPFSWLRPWCCGLYCELLDVLLGGSLSLTARLEKSVAGCFDFLNLATDSMSTGKV